MISYGSNNQKPVDNLPVLLIKKKKNFWESFLKTVLSFAIRLGIDLASAVLKIALPGVGFALAVLLNTGANFVFDIVKGKKINWKSTGLNFVKGIVSATFSSLAIAKPLKTIWSGASKIYSTTNKIVSASKQFINNPINGTINILKNIIGQGSKFSKTFETVGKAINIFEKANNISKNLFNFAKTHDPHTLLPLFNLSLNKLKNTFKTDKMRSFFNGKKLDFNVLGNKKHQAINETLNPDFNKNIVLFNSKWIYGIKVIPDTPNTQNLDILTYFILFKPEATNNKLMIKREGSRSFYENEIDNFISAKSAGRFYLDNIAWGKSFTDLIKFNEGQGNRAYLELASFESLEKFANIKKTLDYSTVIDFNVYQKREAYWKGRKFGNYLLRGYEVKNRQHKIEHKVAYRRENWQQNNLKNSAWTNKGKTLFTSTIISKKPKKL